MINTYMSGRNKYMKLKQVLSIILLLAMPLMLHSETIFEAQRKKQKDMVNKQYTQDMKRKQDLLKKMKAFMNDINGRLGEDSHTQIDNPVDLDKITDITDTDHIHSKKKVPEPVYAYVNTDSVRLRSWQTTSSEVVGNLTFREKVQLLAQSEENETINGVAARWFLVKRENNDEGWAFGAFIQKDIPADKKDLAKPDDSEKKESTGKQSTLLLPIEGKRSSNFGYRVHPVTKKRQSFHKGIDIAAPIGTPVKAAADGIIRKAEFNRNGYGNLIVVEHEKDLTTYYGHLSEILIKPGIRVRKGDLIGKVGTTGLSSGAHLHFEVRRSNKALNPDEFIVMMELQSPHGFISQYGPITLSEHLVDSLNHFFLIPLKSAVYGKVVRRMDSNEFKIIDGYIFKHHFHFLQCFQRFQNMESAVSDPVV